MLLSLWSDLFHIKSFPRLVLNLWVVQKNKLFKKTSHLVSVLLTLECVRIPTWYISFLSTPVVSLMMFCVRFLTELMIRLSNHHLRKHLTPRIGLEQLMSCNLILKIKINGKYFYFLSANFWFWSVKIWFLKLCIQI